MKLSKKKRFNDRKFDNIFRLILLIYRKNIKNMCQILCRIRDRKLSM